MLIRTFRSCPLLQMCIEGVHAIETRRPVVPSPPPPAPLLIYRTHTSRPLSSVLPSLSFPVTLVALDGTWQHTKEMYRAAPWLADVPAVHLDASETKGYFCDVRHAPLELVELGAVSTAEAVACVVSGIGRWLSDEAVSRCDEVVGRLLQGVGDMQERATTEEKDRGREGREGGV